MAREAFKCVYIADDGYVSGGRPKYFYIDPSNLEDDMTDEDLERLFYECMTDAFNEQVSPIPRNKKQFVEWARVRLSAKGK